jgi:hypothetical protein
MVNRGVLGFPPSGICVFYKLGSKFTRICSVNGVLAKSVETGLPKNIGSGTAACANFDELSIVIVAD